MNGINRKPELREAVFLILFRADNYDREGFEEQADDFLADEDCFTAKEKDSVKDNALAIYDKLGALDGYIDTFAEGWKTRRMAKSDLTALRLACFEIRYDESIPVAASINEAVELAKNYGGENSGSFVNGVLARAVKDEQ